MPAKTKKEIEDIQEKIRVLESIGEQDRAAELRKELPAAEPEQKPEVHKKEEQTMAADSGNEFIIGGATEEDYNKATSKFAAAGKHLSEAGMPYWKTPNQSIAFPFIIIEDGADNGKPGEIIAGVGEKAVWKLRQTLDALGVAVTFKAVNGVKRPAFDANEVPGKQFFSLWEEFTDSRSPEQGGKGSKYTKATTAVSLDATDSAVL